MNFEICYTISEKEIKDILVSEIEK